MERTLLQQSILEHMESLGDNKHQITKALSLAWLDIHRYVLVSDETKEQGKRAVATLRTQLACIERMFE